MNNRSQSIALDLETLPGHLIRRLQQMAVAVFMQETDAYGLTPVQYSVLQGIENASGIDQKTLARSIGFDTSTIGSVIDRLEVRGWVKRNSSPEDKRVRLLTLTEEGHQLLEAVVPSMLLAQERMLDPLSKKDRVEFMRMLRILVTSNQGTSRVPGDNPDA